MKLPTTPDGRLTDDAREELIREYLKTDDRRGTLATSTFKPGRDLIALCEVEPSKARLDHARRLVRDMERIQSHFTGREFFDREEWAALLRDLKALCDRLEREFDPKEYRTAWERVLGDDPV